MRLEKHEIETTMQFKVIKSFTAHNKFIKLEVPLFSTLTDVSIYNDYVNFTIVNRNRKLLCNYETFKNNTALYKKQDKNKLQFVYKRYLRTNNYRIILLNTNNRVILTTLFLDLLNITKEEYENILINLGATRVKERDNYNAYSYIAFDSKEKVQAAVTYLNEVYAPMIAILYNSNID